MNNDHVSGFHNDWTRPIHMKMKVSAAEIMVIEFLEFANAFPAYP